MFPKQNETFLYSRKRKPRKNSLYFRKLNFFIFRETEALKIFLYFRRELSCSKNEKTHSYSVFIFWEVELSRPKLKKHLLFQEGTYKAPKTKQKICYEEIYCLLWRFFKSLQQQRIGKFSVTILMLWNMK